jgi:hypothetical protein
MRGTLDETAQVIHSIEAAESALVNAGEADTTDALTLRDIRAKYVGLLQSLLKDLSELDGEASS